MVKVADVTVRTEEIKSAIKDDALWEPKDLLDSVKSSRQKLGRTTMFELLRTGQGSMKTLEKIVDALNRRMEALDRPKRFSTLQFIVDEPSCASATQRPPVEGSSMVSAPTSISPTLSPEAPATLPVVLVPRGNAIEPHVGVISKACGRKILAAAMIGGTLGVITVVTILLNNETDLEKFQRLLSRKLVGHSWRQSEMIFRNRTGKEWAGIKLGNILRGSGSGMFLSVRIDPESQVQKQTVKRVTGKQQVEWLLCIRASLPFAGESTIRISYPLVGDTELPGPTFTKKIAGRAVVEINFTVTDDAAKKIGFYTITFEGDNPRYNNRFIVEEILGPQLERCVVEAIEELGVQVDRTSSSFVEQ